MTLDSAGNLSFDGELACAGGVLNVDRADTTTQTRRGFQIDMDQTGAMAGSNTGVNKGLEIAVNSDAPTMVGTVFNKGLEIDVTGGTSGTQTCIGADLYASGGDNNYGLLVTGTTADIIVGSVGAANTVVSSIGQTDDSLAGKHLIVKAGNAVTGGTEDLNGGNLLLKSGDGDGIGTSMMLFYTKVELSDASIERMRIDSLGNLGIHTTEPEGAVSIGSGYHIITKDMDIRKADSGDNTVADEVIGFKIPANAIITEVVAVVKTASNLSTHLVNIQMSATTETAPDAGISSGTELLGAGVANTDSTDSASTSDIDMRNDPKEVWICRDTVRVGTSDHYLYVCNAGTGNGTTDPSSGTLTVIVKYYGMD